MHVLMIKDKWARQRLLAVDLVDLLRLLIPYDLETSDWFVESIAVIRWHDGNLDLYEGVGDVRRVPGAVLLTWAARLTQVVSCRVYGYRAGASEPWIALRGFDSSFYEVACEDEAIISCMQDRFHDVTITEGPAPEWARPEGEWPLGIELM